jgi:hypothetical protein
LLRLYLLARSDSSLTMTQRIADALRAQYRGVEIYWDAPAANAVAFAQRVETTMQGCNAALVVMGPEWLGARSPNGLPWQSDPYDPVALGIVAAMRQKKLIVPLLIHGALMPPNGAFTQQLAGFALHQAVVLREDPWFQNDLHKVYLQLNTQLSWRPASWLLLSTAIGGVISFILAEVILSSSTGIARGEKAIASVSSQAGFAIGVAFIFLDVACFLTAYVVAFTLAIQRKQLGWLIALILITFSGILVLVSFDFTGLVAWQPVPAIFWIIFALFGKRREAV